MQYLVSFLALFLISIFKYAVALAPISQSPMGTLNQGAFCAVWIETPGRITRFESTLIVPGAPPGSNHSSSNSSTLLFRRTSKQNQALRAVWAGLSSKREKTGILQNVLLNQNTLANNTVDGAWYFSPEWCCDPMKDMSPKRTRQFPNDTITSLFLWSQQSSEYYDNWVITPGFQGNRSGVRPQGGGFTTSGDFDDSYVAAGQPPMLQAILAIQTPPPASWDFGIVQWRNILIEAEGNATKWCTSFPNGNDQFQWSRSPPVATVDQLRNVTSCYFARFTFFGGN